MYTSYRRQQKAPASGEGLYCAHLLESLVQPLCLDTLIVHPRLHDEIFMELPEHRRGPLSKPCQWQCGDSQEIPSVDSNRRHFLRVDLFDLVLFHAAYPSTLTPPRTARSGSPADHPTTRPPPRRAEPKNTPSPAPEP